MTTTVVLPQIDLALFLAATFAVMTLAIGHFIFRPELHNGEAKLKENQSRIAGVAIVMATILALEVTRGYEQGAWMVNTWQLALDCFFVWGASGLVVIALWRRFGAPIAQQMEPFDVMAHVNQIASEARKLTEELKTNG